MRRVSNPIGTTTTFGTYITIDYWTSQPKVTNYYDGVGRIIKTVYQDSTRDSVAYGDNWVKTWDAKGDTAIARTNGFGMADTTVNGLGLLTIVKHDKMGRDSVVTDASGKSTYCYYDTLGRIKGANGPDASSGYYYRGQPVDYLVEYDQLGNISKSMNAKAVVNFSYDCLSRVIRVDSAGSDRVLYRYDSYYDCNYAPTDTMNAKGRITRLITAGIDTTWFVYNKLGNVSKRVFSYAGMGGGRDSVRYVYNTAGACTSLVYPDGTNIRYTYNAIGQLTAAGDYLCSAVYNTTGQPRKIGYGNLTNDSLFYDNRLRLSRLKTYFYDVEYPPAKNYQHLGYTYWEDGNIKQVQDNLNSAYTQDYDYTSPTTYDAAGRLQKCAVGSTVLTYTYDNVGNRTQETVGGTTNSFGYTSGTNKISSANINGTSYTYTHDNTGNITIKSWGGGEYHLFYSYDYKNMLVSVNNDVTNRTVTNYYGGGGSLKVKKTDSQLGSRYYAYEGINPLCEYDSTGTVKKKYVYAFGKCIAYVDSAGNKFWLHQDALGSVKVVTNINGDTVSTYKYYPFGDSLLTRGTSKNDVQFTGKQNIAGIEAYDFSARYYDPELGRFYSIDPLWNSSESPYSYCHNNPVNFTDPSGMQAVVHDQYALELNNQYYYIPYGLGTDIREPINIDQYLSTLIPADGIPDYTSTNTSGGVDVIYEVNWYTNDLPDFNVDERCHGNWTELHLRNLMISQRGSGSQVSASSNKPDNTNMSSTQFIRATPISYTNRPSLYASHAYSPVNMSKLQNDIAGLVSVMGLSSDALASISKYGNLGKAGNKLFGNVGMALSVTATAGQLANAKSTREGFGIVGGFLGAWGGALAGAGAGGLLVTNYPFLLPTSKYILPATTIGTSVVGQKFGVWGGVTVYDIFSGR